MNLQNYDNYNDELKFFKLRTVSLIRSYVSVINDKKIYSISTIKKRKKIVVNAPGY
jgi:hypothetical protein